MAVTVEMLRAADIPSTHVRVKADHEVTEDATERMIRA